MNHHAERLVPRGDLVGALGADFRALGISRGEAIWNRVGIRQVGDLVVLNAADGDVARTGDVAPRAIAHYAALPLPNRLHPLAGTNGGEELLRSEQQAMASAESAADVHSGHGRVHTDHSPKATARTYGRHEVADLEARSGPPFWRFFSYLRPCESPCVLARVAYNSMIVLIRAPQPRAVLC